MNRWVKVTLIAVAAATALAMSAFIGALAVIDELVRRDEQNR